MSAMVLNYFLYKYLILYEKQQFSSPSLAITEEKEYAEANLRPWLKQNFKYHYNKKGTCVSSPTL